LATNTTTIWTVGPPSVEGVKLTRGLPREYEVYEGTQKTKALDGYLGAPVPAP
jgi:hypothetical protein